MSVSSGLRVQRHVLERMPPPDADRPPEPRLAELLAGGYRPPAARRDRLWELSPNLHCSIVGTCLTSEDLRGLVAKLGFPRHASEHDLHARAVACASRKDEGGKLLHKLLERRHARHVQLFAKAESAGDVRAMWKGTLAKGDIAGPYWAVLTHPATDRDLVKEVFGEVHMLSHLLGRSTRIDLRRLAELETEVAGQSETIAEQAARIATLTDDKVSLMRRLDESPPATSALPAAQPDETVARLEAQLERLTEQLGRAEAHARAERTRREEAERGLLALAQDVKAGAVREAGLRSELAALETLTEDQRSPGEGADIPSLAGLTLLYVGGRPHLLTEARRLVLRVGGSLLTHDGGIEESPAALPGLVSQADAVLFPVDCVSHDAVATVKRACRKHAIPALPLRSASLTAFVAATRSLHKQKEQSTSDFDQKTARHPALTL